MARGTRTVRSPSLADLESAARFRCELRRFLHATEAVTLQQGLTPERYDLLLMIRAASEADMPATVTSLREMLDLSQQAVTELVKRAIEAGLVLREPGLEDRRVSCLRLSPEGEVRLLRAFQALRDDRVALAEAFDRVDLRFRAAAAPVVDQPSRRRRSLQQTRSRKG
jgi:DNA-binding MarR family transcriptional regulator